MKKLLSIIITITMVLCVNAATLQMAFADTGDNNIIESISFRTTKQFSGNLYDFDGKTLTVPDSKKSLSIFVTTQKHPTDDIEITVSYTDQKGTERKLDVVPNGLGTVLSDCLLNDANGSEVTIEAVCGKGTEDEIAETRTVEIVRIPTLQSLSLTVKDGEKVELTPKYTALGNEYNISIAKGWGNPVVNAVPYNSKYEVDVTGEETDTISIKVVGGNFENIYKIKVERCDDTKQSFLVDPGTVLNVTDSFEHYVLQTVCTGETVEAEGLISGKEYIYNASRYGYVAKHGSFTAGDNDIISVKLDAAEENSAIVKDMLSSWSNFRGNKANNAVVDYRTPNYYTNTQLYWAKKAGGGTENWSTAPGSPILVDDYLIYTAGKAIYKIDKTSGDVVASGKMCNSSSFNITPPTYAEGMIIVALADGIIQAFNADTLESCWIYNNSHKGQPNCPIAYNNGYIYTGFWTAEDKDADFVCLSATDEQPDSDFEVKYATWEYTKTGGFYWAGAYACDDFVVVTTDNGTKNDEDMGSLIVFDPLSGVLLDKVDQIKGDARASVAYDEETDSFYFTSGGGIFYRVKINQEGKITEFDGSINLGNASRSTPVIKHGRAYVGVVGSGQFTSNSGHHIAVIDLETMKIAYILPTRGFPQTSGMITTAYENDSDDGYTYVYFIDNDNPGMLYALADKPGQTEPIVTRTIEYTEPSNESYDVYNVIFKPEGDHMQYAICSPIADEEGTMYFKNDSGYMFAVGSKIKNIEIVKKPAKTTYESGQCFDPAGMKVVAHLENGLTRNITDYIQYNSEPLTGDTDEIEIIYNHVLYNDEQKFKKMSVWLDVTVECGVEEVTAFNKKIKALPEKVTLDNWKTIKNLRKEYEALDAPADVIDKYLTSYKKLVDAEQTCKKLFIQYFDANPLKVKAERSDYNQISLTWKKSDLDVVYEVYSVDASGKEKKIKTITGSAYDVKSLVCGQKYNFIVKPVLLSGDGKTKLAVGKSGTASAVTSLGKVILTKASATGYDKIALNWKKVSGASGYVIYRSTSKTGTYKAVYTVSSGSTAAYTNTGLNCGTTYYYKIKAYRIEDGSKVLSLSYSEIKSAKTALGKAALKSVSGGKGKITVKWSSVSGASGYEIHRATKKSGKYTKVKTAASGTLSYVNKKLKKGKIYYYKVRAYRTVNNKKVYGAFSEIKSGKTR